MASRMAFARMPVGNSKLLHDKARRDRRGAIDGRRMRRTPARNARGPVTLWPIGSGCPRCLGPRSDNHNRAANAGGIAVSAHYPNLTAYHSACTDIARRRDGSIASYRPPIAPYTWACTYCGRIFPDTDPFAHTRDDCMICYPCAHSRDLARMRTESIIGAYVSCDGRSVTNWPGGILGTIIARNSFTNNMRARIYTWRIRDASGREWHGRNSGPGMCITLRKAK